MNTKPAMVVKAVCNIVNKSEVDTVQSVDGMYRIDVKNPKAKNTLLVKGITVNGVFCPLMDLTPDMLKDTGKKGFLKIVIGNIPSTSDIQEQEIIDAIQGLGFTVRSPTTDEYHWDPDTFKSLDVKSGRKILYVDEVDFELPKSMSIGDRLAYLQYHGKKKNKITEDKPNGNIFDKNKPNNNQDKGKSADRSKPTKEQKEEERLRVLNALKEFSKKVLPFNHNVSLDPPKSPEAIPPSIPQAIANVDPKLPRVYTIKKLARGKHNRYNGGRTQSLERKRQKKRQPSGELNSSDSAKSVKTTHQDYDSDFEFEQSGNPSVSQHDWWVNPQTGLRDEARHGSV